MAKVFGISVKVKSSLNITPIDILTAMHQLVYLHDSYKYGDRIEVDVPSIHIEILGEEEFTPIERPIL